MAFKRLPPGGHHTRAISGRERRLSPEQRREELLDAADTVIRRVGQSVSASLIAAEAGVTKPIIYRHFGDIQDLYQALAVRHQKRLDHWLRAARHHDADLDRRSRFHGFVHAFMDALEREPNLFRFLVRTGGDATVDGEALSWFVRNWSNDIARHLAAIAGDEEGSVRSRTMGVALAGALTAAGSWWLSETAAPKTVVVDALTDLLMQGLPEPAPGLERYVRAHEG